MHSYAKKSLLSLHHDQHDARNLELDSESRSELSVDGDVQYNVIGSDVCMGDHKPVYLMFPLKFGADDSQEASTNVNVHLSDSSYLQTSIKESPEKFPRIESPTYIDLLNDTESMERNHKDFQSHRKPTKTDTTSSSLSSSTVAGAATTTFKRLGDTHSYKETTV